MNTLTITLNNKEYTVKPVLDVVNAASKQLIKSIPKHIMPTIDDLSEGNETVLNWGVEVAATSIEHDSMRVIMAAATGLSEAEIGQLDYEEVAREWPRVLDFLSPFVSSSLSSNMKVIALLSGLPQQNPGPNVPTP
jgi:hypothetical protein